MDWLTVHRLVHGLVNGLLGRRHSSYLQDKQANLYEELFDDVQASCLRVRGISCRISSLSLVVTFLAWGMCAVGTHDLAKSSVF